MNTRRTAIIRILSALSTLILYSKKATACTYPSDNPDQVDIYIPKNNLKKFYFGKIKDYFHQEYTDYWAWSDDIEINSYNKQADTIVENKSVVPITASHNMSFDNEKLYCSKMDILYIDDDHYETHPMYLLSVIHFKPKAIPTFSTRIRMTSNKAKIYAALTFRNIDDNKINHVQISNSPSRIRNISCNTVYNYWYRDT